MLHLRLILLWVKSIKDDCTIFSNEKCILQKQIQNKYLIKKFTGKNNKIFTLPNAK